MNEMKIFIIIVFNFFLFISCSNLSNISKLSDLADPSANINVTKINKYAYIVNSSISVILCNIDGSGGLTKCKPTGSQFPNPLSIAIAYGYAYVTNNDNSLTICTISSSDGTLLNCLNSTGYGFNIPASIAIANGYAYVVNSNNSSVSICNIGANGAFISKICTTNNDSILSNPANITITNGYAYIGGNKGSNTKLGGYCIINSLDGSLMPCTLIKLNDYPNLNYLGSLAVSNNNAFILNFYGNTVALCKFYNNFCQTNNSVLSELGDFGHPTHIVISNGFAYILSYSYNYAIVCTVFGGRLLNCTKTGSGFNIPSSISILETISQ